MIYDLCALAGMYKSCIHIKCKDTILPHKSRIINLKKKVLPHTFSGVEQHKPQIQIQLNKVSLLDNALTHHGMSHLHEAGDIRTLHVVDVTVRFCPIFYALCMDAVHDGMKFFIHFGCAPAKVHGIL